MTQIKTVLINSLISCRSGENHGLIINSLETKLNIKMRPFPTSICRHHRCSCNKCRCKGLRQWKWRRSLSWHRSRFDWLLLHMRERRHSRLRRRRHRPLRLFHWGWCTLMQCSKFRSDCSNPHSRCSGTWWRSKLTKICQLLSPQMLQLLQQPDKTLGGKVF